MCHSFIHLFDVHIILGTAFHSPMPYRENSTLMTLRGESFNLHGRTTALSIGLSALPPTRERFTWDSLHFLDVVLGLPKS